MGWNAASKKLSSVAEQTSRGLLEAGQKTTSMGMGMIMSQTNGLLHTDEDAVDKESLAAEMRQVFTPGTQTQHTALVVLYGLV